MITREELLKTEEFWFESLQNEIYRMVSEYIREEGITQTQFAEKLGVSKGYISQIMNGNFNYTLKKLIELSLAVNKAPGFEFKNLNIFIKEDQSKRYNMPYTPYLNLVPITKITNMSSGETTKFEYVKSKKNEFSLEAA